MSPSASVTADTPLVRSGYAHILRLANGNAVCVHALERSRMVVRDDIVAVLDSLTEPRAYREFILSFSEERGLPPGAVEKCVLDLLAAGLLFAGTREEEEGKYAALAGALLAGDPSATREWEEKWSGRSMERFASVKVARDVESFAPLPHRAAVLVIGFCDVHFAADILRDEARARGIDLTVDAVFEMDSAAAGEKTYDAIIIGALAARHGHWFRSDGEGDLSVRRYVAAADSLIERLRTHAGTPILINNLPVPMLAAEGLPGDTAQRRVRELNASLSTLAERHGDVYVIDADAALSAVGKIHTLDDQLVPTSHLGGVGWWALLPDHELATVHHVRFDDDVTRAFDIRDPYLYDRTLVREQLRWLQTLLAFGRRKCVVVDLDNTLWPGVLADTGSPFPAGVDFSLFSFHSIYVGLHQALKALKHRGVLLACVSKNDESVVRELWKYPKGAPPELLLTPSDFVTWRVNWNEKSDNIRDLAAELNIGLDSIVFIDDHPVERDKVRTFLPEVMVLGDSFFSLRRELLTMPELQVTRVTDEARARTEMTRAQLERDRLRRTTSDPDEYRRTLGLRCVIERLDAESDLERVHELMVRTNQFNTTTRRVPRHQIQSLLAEERGRLYAMHVEDRFTSYGLVGAALVVDDVIDPFVLSCRVIGLGVEHALLRAIVDETEGRPLTGLFVAAARNMPARNLFRDHGFEETADGWLLGAGRSTALPALDPFIQVEIVSPITSRGAR